MDSVSDMPYTSIGDVHNDPTGPAPVRDRGILLRELDGEAVGRIAALAGPGTELPPGQVEIRHLGGALGRMPETPNAISHRDAAFGMNLGMLVPPGHEKRVDGIQQALIDELRPWDTGATLPNFLGSGATGNHAGRGWRQPTPTTKRPVDGDQKGPTTRAICFGSSTISHRDRTVEIVTRESVAALDKDYVSTSFHVLQPANSQSPGGLDRTPGQVRNHLQLRLLYPPTVAGDQENTATISTPRL